MQTLIIDKEFKSMLPTLDKETYRLLEENLLEHGCLTPLMSWNDILIDGHNRYEICTRLGIPFEIVEKDFASREEALIWIISNQVSRRNLTPMQLSYFRGLHYRADKVITKNPGGKNQHSELRGQNDPKPTSTAARLSDKYRVSQKTIKRDARIADAIDAIGGASPDAKRMILSGEVAINRKKLEDMLSWPGSEVATVATQIEDGTYERRQAPSPPPVEGGAPVHTDALTSALTSDFYAMLQKLNNDSNAADVKTVLRAYIKALEELYRSIT